MIQSMTKETETRRSKLALRRVEALLLCLPLVCGCSVETADTEDAAGTDEVQAAISSVDGAITNWSVSQATGTTAAVQLAGISCTTAGDDSTFSVRCTFPGPTLTQYRAQALCTDGVIRFGAWQTVNSGIWSRANCGVNRFIVSRGVQLR